MMQLAIDIPHPLSADTETVITALETAELFSSKGDTQEAVRWLRRAAESAGEAGDDARALALSRTAADLREALEVKPRPVSVPRPSTAPVPRPSTAPTSTPSASPPPASVHSATPPPVPPPLPSQPVASTAPQLPLPPAASAPLSPRPSYPPPPSARPGFHPPVSHPPVSQALPPPVTATALAAAPNPAPNGERHASRVSVTRSPTQYGVFEMRPLADGEPAPAGGSEGFLVMLDKSSTLLSS